VVRLFDHLVSAGEQRRRHIKPERLRGLQVDHQLEPGRLLDWKVSGFFALEDSTNINTGLALQLCPAQQAAMPVIGFLNSGAPPNPQTLTALRKGLSEMGYVEGRNFVIEVRWTEQYEEFPALAADLVRRQVAVIFAWGTANSALAAKDATATIPIVFANGSDPVKSGIVASMARPGGNITGVSFNNTGLVPKRLEVLHEMVPKATTIGFLTNPSIQTSEQNLADMETAIRRVGLRMTVLNAGTGDEIDAAFATARGGRIDALLVGPDAMFNRRRVQLAELAARYRIPANYSNREFCEAGGLSSYGNVPRAASGHAAAAPPMSVMNSRRLMRSLPASDGCSTGRSAGLAPRSTLAIILAT
jgi:putative ABC transport system substrate-binding protein